MGMTGLDFEEFSRLVAQLWPRWCYAKDGEPERGNWNTAARGNIFHLLKSFTLDECSRALRKQRLWDPDAAKPSWNSLVGELRSNRKGFARTPDEIELVERAERETRRMRHWGYANRDRLDAIEQEVYRHRPRLRQAISFARKFNGEVRVWMCEQWERGDRFDDFASDHDVGNAHSVGRLGFVTADGIPF